MRKVLIGIGVVVVVLVVVGMFLPSERILRDKFVEAVEEATGMQVEVEGVDVDIRNSRATFRGITLLSDDSFPDPIAMKIRELTVVYELWTLMGSSPHLPEVVLDIGRAVLVTREDGVTNLEPIIGTVRDRTGDRKRAKKSAPPAPAASSEEDPFAAVLDPVLDDRESYPVPSEPETVQTKASEKSVSIGMLTLRIGEIETRDYSRGGAAPRVRTYRLNMEQVYHDVTDVSELGPQMGADLGFLMAPQVLGDLMQDSGVKIDDLAETILTHEGDLDELGKKLDDQTKELQRSLRKLLR